MPELPEVEAARRRIREVAVGRTIKEAEVADDPIVFQKEPAAAVRRKLLGRKVVNVGRKGKYWWLELDEKPWLFGHFGMSGKAEVLKANQEKPPYTKLLLTLDDGTRL